MRQSIGMALMIAAVALTCCARPTTDQATLKAIKIECQPLLKLQLIEGLVYPDLPKGRWPHVIASLKPESVTILREGVLIEMGSFGAEGWGYFVPRDGGHQPKVGDSRYSYLGQGVFWYQMD
jgi:hypothetical protein